MIPNLNEILSYGDRIIRDNSHDVVTAVLDYARGLPCVGEELRPEILQLRRVKVFTQRIEPSAKRKPILIDVVTPVQVSDDAKFFIADFTTDALDIVKDYYLQVLITVSSVNRTIPDPEDGEAPTSVVAKSVITKGRRSADGKTTLPKETKKTKKKRTEKEPKKETTIVSAGDAGKGVPGRRHRVALLPVSLGFQNGCARLELPLAEVAKRLKLSPRDKDLLQKGLPAGAIWDRRDVQLRLVPRAVPMDKYGLKRIYVPIFLIVGGGEDYRMEGAAKSITEIPLFENEEYRARIVEYRELEDQLMARLRFGDPIIERFLIGTLARGAQARDRQLVSRTNIQRAAFDSLNKARLDAGITLPGIIRYLFNELQYKFRSEETACGPAGAVQHKDGTDRVDPTTDTDAAKRQGQAPVPEEQDAIEELNAQAGWDAVKVAEPGWKPAPQPGRALALPRVAADVFLRHGKPSQLDPVQLEPVVPVMIDGTGTSIRACFRAPDPRAVASAYLRIDLFMWVGQGKRRREVELGQISAPFRGKGVAEIDRSLTDVGGPRVLPVGDREWPSTLYRLRLNLDR
jgi:hypothetical protein